MLLPSEREVNRSREPQTQISENLNDEVPYIPLYVPFKELCRVPNAPTRYEVSPKTLQLGTRAARHPSRSRDLLRV